MTEDNESKLEIDWLRTIAGALAAVSSAVALSTLGAAGTIIGAALGSVIATVGGALYGHGLDRSRRRLAEAQTLAIRKVGVAQAEVRRANRSRGDGTLVDAHLTHADENLDQAKEDLEAIASEPEQPAWRERFATLPWKRIALVAAGLFAAAILAITAFELATGSSVSEITGGSDKGDGPTISRIGGGADETKDEPSQPEGEPDDEPSSEPSPSPTQEEEPTESDDPSPSEAPTSVPTPSEPVGSPELTEPTEPTEPESSPVG